MKMEKEEIQREINKAVNIFKVCLEKTYLEDNIPFYGINYESFLSSLRGKINNHRKNNGSLRISGDLPACMFKKDVKGLPRGFNDWAIYPLVINLFNVDEESFKK